MGFSSDEAYVIQLEQALRAIKLYKKSKMKESGMQITSDQLLLTQGISLAPGINQKDLAEATFKDPASVKRSLDILLDKGYVERELVINNRREHSLQLTETGSEIIHKMLPIAIDLRAKGVKGISGEEMDVLTTVLKKLQDNFEQ